MEATGEITDSQKRLQREYEDFQLYKPADAWGGPVNGNLYEWKVSFYGPKDTDYEDGLFHVKIVIPDNFPQKKVILVISYMKNYIIQMWYLKVTKKFVLEIIFNAIGNLQ